MFKWGWTKKLGIEVDGLSQHWEKPIIKDKKKQADLDAAGFTVLRFIDDEVLNSINVVYEYLDNWIENKIAVNSKSTPT